MDYQGGKGNVQHKCRTCLAREKNMKSLLENSHEMKKLLIKFNAVTKIEIPPNSIYPAYICNICEEKVITFFEFQQSYRTSNDIICAYIQNTSQKRIKVEDKSMDVSEFVDNPNEMFVSQPEAIPISELAKMFFESDIDQNGSDTLDNANFENHSDLNDIKESNMVEGESFESNNDVNKYDIPEDLNIETKNDLNNTNDPKNANVFIEGASSKINEGKRIKTRKELYKCRYCHFRTVFRHSIRLHQRIHTRRRTCVCNVCGKDFLGCAALTKHRRTHFCKIIDCKICRRRFSSRDQLSIHFKEHKVDYQTEAKNSEGHSATNISGLINTNVENNVMELNLKDQIDIYERSVKIQERSTILKPISLPEKKLLKKYPRELIDNTVIMVKRKYLHVNCIYCRYVGEGKRQLISHMTYCHREFMTSWCARCNQVFDDIEKHENPVYFQHFKCPLCKYMCNKLSTLILHLNFHLDEKRFKCDICGTLFQIWYSLQKHERLIHPRHAKSTDGTSEIFNSGNSVVDSNDLVENKPNIGIAEIGVSWSQSNEGTIPGIEGGQCKPFCSSVTSNKMVECITVNTGNCLTEAKNSEGHSATNSSALINTNVENNVVELDLKDEIETYEHSVKIEERSTIFQPTILPKKRVVKKYSSQKAVKKYPRKVIDNAVSMVKRKYLHVNCIFCQFVGGSGRQLVNHVLLHHRKCMATWCSACNQVFDDLKKHKNINHFECPLCKCTFKRKTDLIQHLIYHLDEKRFKCDICGKLFQILYSLQQHKRRKHPSYSESTYGTSEITNSSKNSEDDSNYPIENQPRIEIAEIGISCSQSNEDEAPSIEGRQCKPLCSSITTRKMGKCITVNTGKNDIEEKNKESHATTDANSEHCNMELNSEFKQVSTALPPKPLLTRIDINRYSRKVIENVIAMVKKKYCDHDCSFCEFSGLTREQLISHMRTAHRNLVTRWCSFCNEVSDDLEKHWRPRYFNHFECSLCSEYMCRKLTTLIAHIYTHIDKKPFKCKICGVRCQTSSSLKAHQRRKHISHTKNAVRSGLINNKKVENTKSKTGNTGVIEDVIPKKEDVNVDAGNYQNETKNSESYSATDISGLINTNAENNAMELDLKDEIETYEHGVKIEEISTILQPTIVSDNPAVKKCPREVIDNAVIMIRKKYLHVNCIYCRYVGVGRRDLVTHMTHFHRKFMTNWCSTCNQRFDDLEKHKNHKHFECPLCITFRSDRQSDLMTHLNYHLDEKLYKCDICGKRFQSSGTLRGHKRQKHPSHTKSTDGTSEITNSENSDANNDPIENQHNIGIAQIGISSSQSSKNVIPCIEGEQCKPSCSSATTKKMRECITVNTGCNNTNAENNAMEPDLKDEIETYVHSVKIEETTTILQSTRLPNNRAVKKYPREVIDNVVIMIKKKYLHVNCIYCQYVSVDRRDLVNHMTKFHRKFMTNWCSTCNQVFDDLEKHKSHKHFECPLCITFRCNRQNALMTHLNYHIDEKRYKCDICEKPFQSFGTLLVHKRRKHPSHTKSTDDTSEITNFENSDVVSNDPIENEHNIGIDQIGISSSQSSEDAIPCIEGEQCKPSVQVLQLTI